MDRRTPLLLAVALVWPAWSLGEFIPAQGDGVDPFYAKDSTSGVYVRDSGVALEKFALADRMERAREWAKSADVFQEILQKYPDRVVPSKSDAATRFTSVSNAVDERLSRWPVEGLNVYRARFEAAASALLDPDKPDDVAQLHKVVSLYFVTDTARDALIRLCDIYLEDGQFAASAWAGRRLLSMHPNLVADRPIVLYRTALALHLSGDSAAAKSVQKQLVDQFPQASGTIAGKEVLLTESLATDLASPPPVATAVSGDSWPVFGGSPARDRVSNATGRPGAKLYSIALQQPNWQLITPAEQREPMRSRDKLDRSTGDLLGVIPSVDRGELFFQDGARVYAVSVESGTPLPGWMTTHPTRSGQFALPNAWPLPRATQLTVSVTDTDVLAVMGQSDRIFATFGMIQGSTPFGGATSGARLVSLDRATGKEKWVASTRTLPQEHAALRNLEITGTPLAIGDHVYVGARGGNGAQFEDCYVLCFDRAKGTLVWSCYVASASSGANPWDGGVSINSTTPLLSYAGGRLYVLSNLGASAAIDAYTGSVAWLHLYPRDPTNNPGMNNFAVRARFGRLPDGSATSTTTKPWVHNPPVLRDGKLFVLPTDGKFLTVYDAGTGAELKRVDLAHFDNARELIGVVGDKLILGSDDQIWCLRWTDYNPTTFKGMDDDCIEWMTTPGERRGRAFVTDESVVVSTDRLLSRIDLRRGRVVQNYPTADRVPQQWVDSEGPGNVLLTAEHVIVAGDARVDVYTDLDMARQKLEREIAAAPNDPAPRLRFAEVMFVSGQSEAAVTKLDEAITLLGGPGAMRTGDARDRVFNNALSFAEKMSGATTLSATARALTDQLFDRAAFSAETPLQQVAWRASRARFAASQNQPDLAVRWWQEILSDDALRAVPLIDEQTGASGADKASTVAAASIDRLLRTSPDAYRAFDAQAQQAFEQAKATDDARAMLALSRTFPNSRVAADAMLFAASKFERDGDAKQATQVLRTLYIRYPRGPHTAPVLEAMARNYLALPDRLDAAVARMNRAAQVDPQRRLEKPLRLPGGRTLRDITYTAAAVELKRARASAVADELPTFNIPSFEQYRAGKKSAFVPPAPDTAVTDVGVLLVPTRDQARYDRVVTWTQGVGVRAFGVDASPLWVCPAFDVTPTGCAWVGDDLIVWSDKHVALLRPKDAKLPAPDAVKIERADGAERVEGAERADGAERAKGAGRVEVALIPVVPVVWKTDATSLPMPLVVAPVSSDVLAGGDGAEQPVVLQRNRRAGNQNIILNARLGRQRIVLPAPVELVQNADGGANNEPGEKFTSVRVAGDRIMIGSTAGRVVALDTADGSLAWQMRLSDRPVERLIAGDDFTVVRVVEEGTVQVTAFDTLDGQVVFRRPYITEGGAFPVNLTLSSDGAMVLMMPDRLIVRDLYQSSAAAEAGDASDLTTPNAGVLQTAPSPDGVSIFATSALPEQLIVSEGRILAVSDSGQFVRAYSLERGNELMKPLSTGAPGGSAALKMRLVGSQLYITSPRSLMSYNLDKVEHSWSGDPVSPGNVNIKDLFVGRDYVFLLDQPAERLAMGNRALPTNRLHGFSREMGENGEAGRYLYADKITDATGIQTWQEIDGGLCYVTGDKKMHFLRGAK